MDFNFDLIVYQTLENRRNSFAIERDGPFPCRDQNTWLGPGYYFWESFIENAHWWGKDVRKYANGYIICRGNYNYDPKRCFDLLNPLYVELIRKSYDYIQANELQHKCTLLKHLVYFTKDNISKIDDRYSSIEFEAIRAVGEGVRHESYGFNIPIKFEKRRHSYQEICPPIQICFLHKKALNLRDYKIEYIDKPVGLARFNPFRSQGS